MLQQITTNPSAPSTLCDLLDFHVQSYAIPNALNEKREGRWVGVASSELLELVRQTALGLYAVGVRPGDRVALLSENSPHWIIADYAITSLGAAGVPIYMTQAIAQIEYVLKNAGVRVFLISSKPLYDRVHSLLSKLELDHIIVFSPFTKGANIITLDELRAKGKALDQEQPDLFHALRNEVTPETVATVIYTSGTTGEPKGVVLTHRNLTSNAVDASSTVELGKEDVGLSYLPLSHIFERIIINIYLYRGVSIYFAESIEKIAQDLLEVRPTVMSTVPRLLEKVYDRIQQKGNELHGLKRALFDWSMRLATSYKLEGGNGLWYNLQRAIASVLVFSKWRKALGGRMRFIISGGAALPPWLATIYHAAGIIVLQGYGLTETSPVITVNRVKRNRIGSVGPTIPHVDVRIADDGEILVKGPNVMKGFYNAPEATKAVFDGEWFRTGDIGYVDKDGFLFITDRKKDLIKKSTGKFVAPAPIENKLLASRYIEYAVLVGEGRKFVLALIFPSFANLRDWAAKNAARAATDKDLLALPTVRELYEREIAVVNEQLNPWERITKFLLIDSEPTIALGDLTPTLKMRRRIIEQKYKDQIDAIYREFEHLHDLHW